MLIMVGHDPHITCPYKKRNLDTNAPVTTKETEELQAKGTQSLPMTSGRKEKARKESLDIFIERTALPASP